MKGQIDIELSEYDLVIINSSGGKDSLCAVYEICRMAKAQGYDKSKIAVSHQDLGRMEWEGTKDLVAEQSKLFGLETYYSKYRNKDGEELTLLDYVEKRGKWASNKQRYCTSDFKRAPGARIVTMLTKGLGECKVLYVFGFRKQESPARSKKEVLKINTRLTTKKRTVVEFLPIHNWDEAQVWDTIKENNLPYHKAYKLGMPRLSCVFCIFSPFDALVLAGKNNPQLLEEYVATEAKIGHTFTVKHSLADVKKAIEDGYEPTKINDWTM